MNTSKIIIRNPIAIFTCTIITILLSSALTASTDAITVTYPAGNESFSVSTTQSITWTTDGSIPFVRIEYSKDNFINNGVLITSTDNTGSYLWTIPDDITSDFRVKVRVSSSAVSSIYDNSEGFKVRANIIVTSPVGNERWVTNETHPINWAITGTVPSVAIYYSTDNFVSDVQLIATTANTGYYYWKIPDRGGLKPRAKVRVCDSRDTNSYDQSPNFFKIDYYYITFEIKDAVTSQHLRALTFMDPTRGWAEYPVSSPRTWGYPYGTYVTIITKVAYLEDAIELWVADRDKTFLRYMESSIVHSWQIPVDFRFEPSNNRLVTTAWFMRDGLIMWDPLPQSIRIELYDGNSNFVKTLQSNSPTNIGIFTIIWENITLQPNVTYLAKTELTYSDMPFRSALTFKIDLAGWPTVYTTTVYTHYWEVKGNFNYNHSANRLETTAWLTYDGLVVNTPDSVNIAIRDHSGRTLNTLTPTLTSSVHDTWGVFRLNWDNPALDNYQTYTAYISISYRGTEYEGIVAFEIEEEGIITGSSGVNSDDQRHKAWYKPWTGCGYLGIEPFLIISIIIILRRVKHKPITTKKTS